MNKQQAQQLIQETFETTFDKGRFNGFARNLLNHIQDASFTYQGNYIPEKFRQYIKTLERIGKFSDGEHTLDILIITLQKETSLERARTMQRNFIAWYLNGSRGGEMKDAALVAYVSPDQTDWRFSLVKMDYKFEKTKTGKLKVKEEFTPARRWSFLVGVNEKSHTAQSRLVKILADDEHAPTLEELEEAFNIETVTKEFFLKYRELFLRTKEALDKVVKKDSKVKANFDAKGVDTVNFAKKLLGQIVFLYFLQKKGWFGVGRDDGWGTGSKHFLRSLLEKKHGDYKNFFNDILEPLFYEALRIDRSHHDDYYSRFNCKIPFLNGGLFDPIGNYDWVHTDIHLSNDLFSNTRKTNEGDIGDGILDVFDRYNFTVREDEPLEKEVAIDPELLGKAYEKFNAIRPDNFEEFTQALKSGKKGEENKFNKKFGVYYTPREIVHYMCKQSLINYLATRTEEAKLEIPISKQDIEDLIEVGEMITEHEATALIKEQNIKNGIQKSTEYTALLSDGIRQNAKHVDNWLADITVCDPAAGSGAFPVGMMNEIVRARNVLSVFLNNQERSDYEFKRRCIEHSLYGVDIDPGAVEIAKLRLWLSLVVDEEDIKNIKPLPNLDYKIVCGNSLLGVEKDLFNQQLFNDMEKLKPLFFSETNPTKKQEYIKQIDDLISRITNGHKEFDFEVYFSEVFHAKGGFDVVIANPPWGSGLTKEEKKILKLEYPKIDSSTPNSYAYFLGLAKRITKNSIAYILPDSILMKDYAKTRKYLSPNIKIIRWFQNVGLPDLIRPFENVEHDVCLLIIPSNICDRVLCSTSYYDSASKTIETKWWESPKNEVIFEEFDFIFNLKLTQKDLKILYKINKFKPMNIFMQCHEGIHTGNSREILFKEKKENQYCKPLYYGGGAGDIINNYKSFRSGWYVDYRQEIIDKKKGYYASLRDERIFKYPKIYITRTGNPFKAFLDNGSYASNNFFSLQYKDYSKNTIDSLKIILPFIVSRLTQYFIRTFAAPRLGNIFVETKIIHLLRFKIPDLSKMDFTKFSSKISQILAITKSDDYLQNPQQQARVKELEREIDQLVFKIYGLTEEEIRIVEDEGK